MISVSNLNKRYENTLALKGISFDIKKGEFFGLLGPNGAGKTTTISIMSSILNADSGKVTIGNYSLTENPAACKQLIGVVPQELSLYNDLSATENLKFWGSLYHVPKKELATRINTLLKLFGLYERKDDKVKNYSGGMKRRINIASALLHNPEILFMDEPTVGIDPQSRNLIFEVIEKLHKEGITIVYTTHYMEEAERFCNRIAIIDDGRIIAQGSLDELKKSVNLRESIQITFTDLNEESFKRISNSWTELDRNESGICFYSSNTQNDLSKIILKCNESGLNILSIDIQKVNLETIFLNLTGKQLRD